MNRHAEMAELADAHGSGPCGSNTMRVQVPFSALLEGYRKAIVQENPDFIGVLAICRAFSFPGGKQKAVAGTGDEKYTDMYNSACEEENYSRRQGA